MTSGYRSASACGSPLCSGRWLCSAPSILGPARALSVVRQVAATTQRGCHRNGQMRALWLAGSLARESPYAGHAETDGAAAMMSNRRGGSLLRRRVGRGRAGDSGFGRPILRTPPAGEGRLAGAGGCPPCHTLRFTRVESARGQPTPALSNESMGYGCGRFSDALCTRQ